MPNNEYANEPNQSRSEEIISSILDGEQYDEPARSRIEYLLIQLKEAIEGGGGGGGVTSYSPLTEKPKIDNNTLQAGNNSSSDLGLQTKIDTDHKLSADVIDDTNSTNKFNVKSDWNAASGAAGEILNKPTLGTASAKNVPVSGNAGNDEVVLGSDERLTDSRNAKDVYNWAKQANKPSYAYNEITGTPTIPTKLSDLTDDATHRTVTDTEKTTWSGKQNALTFDDAPTNGSTNPVKSGGVYTALSGKQASLDETQMAAVNSGINSTKVAQIETNKTNILLNWQTGKNKLDNTLSIGTTTTSDGKINVTTNADKSITLTRTASSSSTQFITINDSVYLEAGEYVFFGCPSGGSGTTYEMRFLLPDGSAYIEDKGDGATFTLSTAGTISAVAIRIGTGFSPNAQTYYPMIISKALYDSGLTQYQPYALPNTTLTPALVECVDNGTKNRMFDYQHESGKTLTNTLTFTINADGSITLNGTSGASSSGIDLARYVGTGLMVFSVQEPLSGVDLRIYNASQAPATELGKLYSTNTSVVINHTGIASVGMAIEANKTFNNVTIKPMVCTLADWNMSHEYQPFALTNPELTKRIAVRERTSTTTTFASLIYNEAVNQGLDTNKILTYTLSVYTATDNEYVCAYGVYKHGVMHRCVSIVNNTISISAFNNLGTIALSGGTAPYYAKVRFF